MSIRKQPWSVLALCLLCACAPDDDHVNILLVTVDTLRADHLGCYGYSRPTSPNIDRLAASATLYTRSWASAPWTVPSHASLFTGLYPFEHGAHSFPVEDAVTNVNPLSEDMTTLAELLSDQQWNTGAFVANSAFLDSRWGLAQGFDDYFVENRYAGEQNKDVFTWLEQKTRDSDDPRPFFLFVNYMDTHWPYNTAERPGFTPEAVSGGQRRRLKEALIEQILPADGDVPTELVRVLHGQYDTSIANVDQAIGGLVERLHDLGIYDRTILVITSDHGEYLGEHHLVGHSKDVYEGALRIPLVIKYARQRRRRVVDTPVSSPNVARMLADALPTHIGKRLAERFPYQSGNRPVIAENYYSRLHEIVNPVYGHRFQRVRTAIYDYPWKYIRSSDGAHELYRLDQDSDETANRIGDRQDLAQRLDADLSRFQAERQRWTGTFIPPALDEDEIRELRALGYVGN